jgi:imidazolonepropionase-like amidohydrolase
MRTLWPPVVALGVPACQSSTHHEAWLALAGLALTALLGVLRLAAATREARLSETRRRCHSAPPQRPRDRDRRRRRSSRLPAGLRTRGAARSFHQLRFTTFASEIAGASETFGHDEPMNRQPDACVPPES